MSVKVKVKNGGISVACNPLFMVNFTENKEIN